MRYCPVCDERFKTEAKFCPTDGSKLVEKDEDERDPLIGVNLEGKYLISELIGQGGMGTVYKATQGGMDRVVAVKILKRQFFDDEDITKRFFREAKAASSLTNQHTITIHDFGQMEDKLLYIVMEYLEGKTLAGLMFEAGPLDVRQALVIMIQASESLEEAHNIGVVHRDLKPDNIFLCRRANQKDHVKILDFGVAKLTQSDKVSQITEKGVVFGTPSYMSTEQAEGKEADWRSDIYSLGIVFFEMLTGRKPFLGEGVQERLFKRLKELPPSLKTVCPDLLLVDEIDYVVQKMLAMDRTARYQDMQLVREDLRKIIREVDRARTGSSKDNQTVEIFKPVKAEGRLGRFQDCAGADSLSWADFEIDGPAFGSISEITTEPELSEPERGWVPPPVEAPVRRQSTFYSLKSPAALNKDWTKWLWGGVPLFATTIFAAIFLATQLKDNIVSPLVQKPFIPAPAQLPTAVKYAEPLLKEVILEIDSRPAGARILLDNKAHGVTPGKLALKRSLKPRQLSLLLNRYQAVRRPILPDKGQYLYFEFRPLKRKSRQHVRGAPPGQ